MKVGARSALFVELEVAAARLLGDLSEAAVRLASDHPDAVEEFALKTDRIHHHFFGARAIDDRSSTGAARGVLAVGEHENHTASLDSLELVETDGQRIVQTRAVAVVEAAHLRNQIVAVAAETSADFDLVVERADLRLVVGEQPDEELFGGVAQQRQAAGHAAARIEHDDDRDRKILVLEQHDRLRLVVVANLEIFLHQARHQTPLRIRDGDEQRHDLRARAERWRWLLLRRHAGGGEECRENA